jgi:hypothetical protein
MSPKKPRLLMTKREKSATIEEERKRERQRERERESKREIEREKKKTCLLNGKYEI